MIHLSKLPYSIGYQAYFKVIQLTSFDFTFKGTLNRNSLLNARNGKPMRALDIFSKALGFLKDKALERIHQQSGVEYKAREVRWVVTVPAIWKQSAKQFMREAAYEVS